MQVLQGIAVSPGIAIGEALIVDNAGFQIPRREIMRCDVSTEIGRLEEAIEAVSVEIGRDRDAASRRLGRQYGAIFSAHEQMLRDCQLGDEIRQLIRDELITAELAVSRTFRRYVRIFEEMEGAYLAERAHDVADLEKRLLEYLLGHQRAGLADLTSSAIILAHDLTPSETARLNPQYVLGFVTEAGGEGGHTAILAKGLELPAVVGIGPLLRDLKGGEQVIIDGDLGKVILEPDRETLAEYHQIFHDKLTRTKQLDRLRDLPAQTADGVDVLLMANIEFPHEAVACTNRGATGIGLYRTEFLYLGADVEPTEEDHYNAYSEVVHAMGDQPVVIRTMDLGADKLGQLPPVADEHNPCLGLRSIRFSLQNLPIFRTQLRAILRASAVGNVQVMFPLITTLQELRQSRMLLHNMMEDLEEEGIPFRKDMPVGMMVEVPAAVTMIDVFIKEVDFISIGTNDLIQYALAVDRSNKDVAHLYQACDPAVLRLINTTLKAARQAQVPASICGQMSGIPHFALLLLGLGLRSFSVAPSSIPEIKQLIRNVNLAQCEEIAERAMHMEGAREIDTFLKEELRKLVPALVP